MNKKYYSKLQAAEQDPNCCSQEHLVGLGHTVLAKLALRHCYTQRLPCKMQALLLIRYILFRTSGLHLSCILLVINQCHVINMVSTIFTSASPERVKTRKAALGELRIPQPCCNLSPSHWSSCKAGLGSIVSWGPKKHRDTNKWSLWDGRWL